MRQKKTGTHIIAYVVPCITPKKPNENNFFVYNSSILLKKTGHQRNFLRRTLYNPKKPNENNFFVSLLEATVPFYYKKWPIYI